MTRPCFLVVDREHAGSLSTRKLVIETAKLNVITAFSGAEAIETFRRFPAVDGVILDSHLEDISCESVAQVIKEERSNALVIVVGSPMGGRCDAADHVLESFNPTKLLQLLTRLNSDAQAVLQQDEKDQAQEGEQTEAVR